MGFLLPSAILGQSLKGSLEKLVLHRYTAEILVKFYSRQSQQRRYKDTQEIQRLYGFRLVSFRILKATEDRVK